MPKRFDRGQSNPGTGARHGVRWPAPPVQPGRLAVASFAFARTVTAAAACRPIGDADLARAAAQGVARVDAKIVEDLHVVALRALIARVGAIAAAVAW